MARGKRTAETDAWGKREWRQLRQLSRMAGGREGLIRRIDECPPEPTLGAPRRDFFKEISGSELPWKGLYLVCVRTGNNALLVFVVARPKGHRVKPKDPLKTGVELHNEEKYGKNWQFPTTHQAIREIVKIAWKACEEASQDADLSSAQREQWNPRRRLGSDVETITRGLTSKLRKKARTAQAL